MKTLPPKKAPASRSGAEFRTIRQRFPAVHAKHGNPPLKSQVSYIYFTTHRRGCHMIAESLCAGNLYLQMQVGSKGSKGSKGSEGSEGGGIALRAMSTIVGGKEPSSAIYLLSSFSPHKKRPPLKGSLFTVPIRLLLFSPSPHGVHSSGCEGVHARSPRCWMPRRWRNRHRR